MHGTLQQTDADSVMLVLLLLLLLVCPCGCYVMCQFTFLLDDVGIPLNYRHMEGFGVHTFMLLNAAGKETLVEVPLEAQVR